ncbi:Hypothetical predicted protein [Lecanosticta acicola]|uniref:Shelterin complex subunit TPP1/Est3 domain-containing protein n=1 Tax=Lecanosticta acicola TaxID=111012 RepID=A0AAI8Z1E0_9PEZI|nr:Hypothetical predicted protein [Lecanosticta acicola]
MGKASLEPWLADFLWGEIAAVISWKKHLSTSGVKPDPDGRFSDDGSSFRCHNHSDPGHVVQLITVLSLKDGATVLLSDGEISIKARLSESVVALLEEETEQKFGHDTVHDVFQLKDFTVVSTTYGPEDGLVQLSVDNIEYEHHLRKTKGNPMPVQEAELILQLIHDIEQLRCPQPAAEDHDEATQDLEDQSGQVSHPNQIAPVQAVPTIAVPRSSMAAPASTSKAQSQISPRAPMQSQSAGLAPCRASHLKPDGRTKPLGRSLVRDGFEVATGVNLQRPVQAASGSLSSKQSKPSVRSSEGSPVEANEARRTGLLSLFKQGRKSPPRSPAAQPEARRASPDIIVETPTRTRPTGTERALSKVAHSSTGLSTHQHTRLERHPSPPSAQPPPSPNKDSRHSTGGSRLAHGRCKIPKDQMKILEKPSSWLPSLPGHQFPRPNVPIALLQKWNQANRAPAKVIAKDAALVREGNISSSSDDAVGSSSDDSDEELPASQWPPTPTQRRTSLPPDSSLESRPLSSGELEIAAPRALPHRKSSHKPSQHSGHTMHPSVSPHALPPTPTVGAASALTTTAIPASQLSVPQKSALKRPREESMPLSSAVSASHSKRERSYRVREPVFGVTQSFPKSGLPGSSPPAGPNHSQASDRSVAGSSSLLQNPRHIQPTSSVNGTARVQTTQLPRSTPPVSAPKGSRAIAEHSLSSPYRNPSMVGRQSSTLHDTYRPSPSRPRQPVKSDDGRSPQSAPNSSQPRLYSPYWPSPSNGQSAAMNAHDALSSPSERPNNRNDQSDDPPDPAEVNRAVRREHMQHGRRRDWIQERYLRDDEAGLQRFEHILTAYRAECDDNKEDGTLSPDFAKAVQAAYSDFPDQRLASMRFTSRSDYHGSAGETLQKLEQQQQAQQMPARPNQPPPSQRSVEMAKPNKKNMRRCDWLQKQYTPTSTGELALKDVYEEFRAQHSNDHIHVKDFTKVLGLAFSKYSQPQNTRFTHRIAKHDSETRPNQERRPQSLPTTRSNEVSDQDRRRAEWLRERYVPDDTGMMCMADMMATYQLQDLHDRSDDADWGPAIQTAFPGCERPQHQMRFTRRVPQRASAPQMHNARMEDASEEMHASTCTMDEING